MSPPAVLAQHPLRRLQLLEDVPEEEPEEPLVVPPLLRNAAPGAEEDAEVVEVPPLQPEEPPALQQVLLQGGPAAVAELASPAGEVRSHLDGGRVLPDHFLGTHGGAARGGVSQDVPHDQGEADGGPPRPRGGGASGGRWIG